MRWTLPAATAASARFSRGERTFAQRISLQYGRAGRKPARWTAPGFAEAAAESARCGAVFWEVRSLLLGAPPEAAAGRGRGGTRAWLRGRRLAEAGGSGMLVGLADATRPPGGGSEVPYGSPDRAELTHRPATLTARELEMAELVAHGLTSQAIADRLYVSRRTVETHVSRAFRKTGVFSRTALATLMARRRTGSRSGDARAEQD